MITPHGRRVIDLRSGVGHPADVLTDHAHVAAVGVGLPATVGAVEALEHWMPRHVHH